MPIKISIAASIAGCNAVAALLDAAGTDNKLAVYSGTLPANADAALSGNTKLIEFNLADPAFATAVDANGGGTATLDNDPVLTTTALATGTATFFRLVNGAGATVIQGDVTDTAGSGSMKLSSVAVIIGIDVSVVSVTLTLPRG